MGYSYGKSIAQRSTASSYTKDKSVFLFGPSPTPSLSPTIAPTASMPFTNVLPTEALSQTICGDGFQAIVEEKYSLCLPAGFSKQMKPQEDYYVNGDQELAVYENSSFAFPIDICTFEQSVSVDGYTATRSIFHEETGGGCGGVTGFATRISVDEHTNYLIRLFRTNGTFENEQHYEALEQSFVLQK